ncbi:MAG: DUF547 domain-containing protein [Ignavibacteria bacterium]
MVNYRELKDDAVFNKYIEILENTEPSNLINRNEKLAFWINVYNAFTLKIIVDNYPLESINDLHIGGLIMGTVLGTTIWDDDFISINGKKYSLNNIDKWKIDYLSYNWKLNEINSAAEK